MLIIRVVHIDQFDSRSIYSVLNSYTHLPTLIYRVKCSVQSEGLLYLRQEGLAVPKGLEIYLIQVVSDQLD